MEHLIMASMSRLRGLHPARIVSWSEGNRRCPAGSSARGFRPRLEGLEHRCMLSGGVLDPTFGSGGLVTTTVGTDSRAYAVATYPNAGNANDGKIVAVGDGYTTTG